MNCSDSLFQQLDAGQSLDPQDLTQRANVARTRTGDCLIHRCRTIQQLQQLVEHTGNIDQRGAGGATALMRYADVGNCEFCALLLQHGANPNPLELQQLGPLHFANNPEIVELLLSAGANIEARDGLGQTPFLFAIFHKQHDGMAALADHAADIRAEDFQGSSALHLAARVGNCEAIEFCLQKGFTVNQTTKNDQTPLHFSVSFNQMEATRLLLERGANPNVRDRFGNMVLDCVPDHPHPELVALLKRHGALPTIIAAFSGSKKQFIRKLLKHPYLKDLTDKLRGASELDVATLEQQCGLRLPAFYRELLLVCGRGGVEFFEGCEWKIDQLDRMSQNVSQFCQEEQIVLPATAFVFLSYLGENFWLFDTNEGENPQVSLLDVEGIKPTGFRFADFVLHWR